MITITLKDITSTCILVVCTFFTVVQLFTSAAFWVLSRIVLHGSASSTYTVKAPKSAHRRPNAIKAKRRMIAPTSTRQADHSATPDRPRPRSDINRDVQDVKARALAQRDLLRRLMAGDDASPDDSSDDDANDLSFSSNAHSRKTFNEELQEIKARALAQQSLLRCLMEGDASAMDRLGELPDTNTRAYTHHASPVVPLLRLMLPDGKATEDHRIIYAIGSRPLGTSASAAGSQDQ